ncbi:MAG TPA: prepilin-type N-terminal cleavage/methylation domain-containing protein [Arenimonas sp.]|uniref:prepilin-type N-terminal cleavage/methylation domain-containing protein n=1 Tax=Arenimonas sp. TaxID=1872635 RepID=UPI002D7F82A7|nr:prepilin-type N-terminal cleavage/methylation domain-containing protein [Arenimonas sp.]HEU0153018.1 prepilin-type N-terminal cleavage/methylation domain-containing protein [Arenimonas sp.]
MASPFPNVPSLRRGQRGFSLIELMIAMLLGLLVVAAAGGVFLSNKRVYNATETLGRIQENTRVAFELMSRDIREAGGNPCGTSIRPINMMNQGNNAYWSGFNDGLIGYDAGTAAPGLAQGTAVGQRVAGTDVIELYSSAGGGLRVISHPNPSAELDVSSTGDIVVGDVLLVCNIGRSFIFEVTSLPGTGDKIGHNAGAGDNCSARFTLPVPADPADEYGCDNPDNNANSYCFTPQAGAGSCGEDSSVPAFVSRAVSIRWFVGNNARAGRSLYRVVLANRSNTNTPDVELSRVEVAEGVDDLQITYLEAGSNAYTAAAGVADWSRVLAARLEVRLEGTQGALSNREVQGTDGNALNRTVTHVVALRNRESTL